MGVRGNFGFLLAALIGLLLWVALALEFREIFGHGWLINAAFETTLLAGVWSLAHDRRKFITGVILAALGFSATVLRMLSVLPLFEWLGLMAAFLFYLLSLQIAFRQLFIGPVDTNKIMGAISIYLMVGLCWALLFFFNTLFDQGAVKGLEAVPSTERLQHLIYFSFVTLSTLGYGDITPLSPIARFLAYLEALFGQFYIAVLVAGFVSGGVIRRQREYSDE